MSNGQGRSTEFGALTLSAERRELLVDGAVAPLSSKAFDIARLLVEAQGRLVTKDEIMLRVWPRLIVDENNIQVAVSALRKALGPHGRLIRTVSGRGYQLLPVGQAASHSSNLPAATAALVGREAALADIIRLMGAHRVVTLTGTGGIGKTRLAIEAARKMLPAFGGRVHLVELASLSNPRLAPSAAASALDLSIEDSDVSPASLARTIGDRKLLLVLDNCEHIVDAAARLAETIARLCPNASILATSREALRVEGESVYRVSPLGFPPAEEEDPDRLRTYGAIQLFIARTPVSRGDPMDDAAILRTIAAICRRLDGIPLAIEFAAARAATLGPAQVAAHIDDRFSLLTGGHRTALPRQQTLRATLDWSYELLPEAERRLLRRLAVFAGGFTLEAAQAVADDGDNVMDGIANLAAKSLVALDGSGWRLLETIRAYALEKLTGSGEAEQAARCHAAYFSDLLGLPATEAGGMDRHIQEIDNVRAALDWSFSLSGDTRIGVLLTAGYAPVWLHLSLLVECRERTEQALRALARAPSLDTRLGMQLNITLAASLLHAVGANAEAAAILGDALDVATALDEAEWQLRALWAMWSYRHNIDHRASDALAERFHSVARRTGDPADALVGERLLGCTKHYGGDQAAARRHIEHVLAHYVAPAEQRHACWFHHDQRVLSQAMLTRILWVQGHVAQAKTTAQMCLEAAQQAGQKLAHCYALGEAVCPLQIMTGDFAAAARSVAMFTELATRHSMNLWRSLAPCLDGALKIKRGASADGTAQLRNALQTAGTAGLMIRKPEFLGILAEGLAGTGNFAAALGTINEALDLADHSGQRWFYPELLRIKGEVMLQAGQHVGLAEILFRESLIVARTHGALFWEQRTAQSLAACVTSRGSRRSA